MSIVESSFLDEIRNSMGNSTYCTLHGKTIQKRKVKKNRSKTLPQQKQRLRMKTLIELFDVYESAVERGFPQRPIDHSPFNAFIKANQDAVEVSDELEVTVSYEKVVFSMGKREVPETTVTADNEAGTLTFVHEVEEFGKHAEPTDMLYAVLVEKQKRRSKVFPLNTRKESQAVTITLPKGWSMDNLEMYVFVLSANKHKASKPLYLTV